MFEHCSMVILGHVGTPVVSNPTAVARKKKGILLKIQTWQNEKLFLKVLSVMNTKENCCDKKNKRYHERYLPASSLIWESEASRARTRLASPLACLSRVHFSRYSPNRELARRLRPGLKSLMRS